MKTVPVVAGRPLHGQGVLETLDFPSTSWVAALIVGLNSIRADCLDAHVRKEKEGVLVEIRAVDAKHDVVWAGLCTGAEVANPNLPSEWASCFARWITEGFAQIEREVIRAEIAVEEARRQLSKVRVCVTRMTLQ